MKTEDDYKEEERERIIKMLMGHRSEFRVCWYYFDGYHTMLSEEELRAKLAPEPTA